MMIWDRYIKVIITKKNNEKIIIERTKDNKNLFMKFDIDFGIDENSNICRLEIYNLAIEIVREIRRNCIIEVEAGYFSNEEKNVGLVFKGEVEQVQGRKEETNIIYTIESGTFNDEYKHTIFNLSAGKNVSALTIITTLLSKCNFLKKGKIELLENKIYKNGKTLNNNIKSIFSNIAKDCKSVFYVRDGYVYFEKPKTINRGLIELDMNIIQSITQNENGFSITQLFDHSIQEGYKLKIDFFDEIQNIKIKGEYPIVKGRHSFSLLDEAITEYEIKTILEEKEQEINIKINSPAKPK